MWLNQSGLGQEKRSHSMFSGLTGFATGTRGFFDHWKSWGSHEGGRAPGREANSEDLAGSHRQGGSPKLTRKMLHSEKHSPVLWAPQWPRWSPRAQQGASLNPFCSWVWRQLPLQYTAPLSVPKSPATSFYRKLQSRRRVFLRPNLKGNDGAGAERATQIIQGRVAWQIMNSFKAPEWTSIIFTFFQCLIPVPGN